MQYQIRIKMISMAEAIAIIMNILVLLVSSYLILASKTLLPVPPLTACSVQVMSSTMKPSCLMLVEVWVPKKPIKLLVSLNVYDVEELATLPINRIS